MIYVLTREINCYDQDGAYFVHAWKREPSLKDISLHTGRDEEYSTHVLSGGGRIGYEDEWYNLEKIV